LVAASTLDTRAVDHVDHVDHVDREA